MKAIQFFPVVCALAVYVARMIEIKTKRAVVAGKVRENLTLVLFMITGSLTFLCAMAEYFWRGAIWQWNWLILGIVCAIFSFWLRGRAIAALGRFWSLHVEIRENHEFVQSGPFRWMRHPAYFSMVLELLSLCFIFNAFYSLLIIPIFFIPSLLLRLRIEEAALVEKFGDTYRDYQRQVPALFPYKGPCR
jgi:protein-S-isoprenylcysteine O-methyltransferase Ste14